MEKPLNKIGFGKVMVRNNEDMVEQENQTGASVVATNQVH